MTHSIQGIKLGLPRSAAVVPGASPGGLAADAALETLAAVPSRYKVCCFPARAAHRTLLSIPTSSGLL